MPRSASILARLAGGFALTLAAPVRAETVADAIADACATNPTLAAARARQDALAETIAQARAAGRLTAEIDAAGGYSRFDYGKGGSGSVTASLPIWTGGRVPAAVRAATGDVAAGAEGLRDTEAGVLEAVVSAYAEMLYNQQAVEVAKADIALLDHQVAEARSRFALGQATRTDVAQLEAQRDSAAATLADAQGTLDSVAASYRATVGRDADRLIADAPPPGLPGTLDEARQIALDDNPLLREQQRVADADGARIAQQRAEGAPSLGLNGAYGYAGGMGRGGYGEAAIAGVTLRIPLLTGGLVASRVRQSEAAWRADRFSVDAARREAARAIEVAWAALGAARRRAQANEHGVTAADLALKGVRAEYAFGLRTTLDILVADESLRGAQLALARARSDLLLAEAGLLRALGRLDAGSWSTDAPAAQGRCGVDPAQISGGL